MSVETQTFQSRVCDERDALLLALEILAREASTASLKRAAVKLESDPYWNTCRSAPAAASELRLLLTLKR